MPPNKLHMWKLLLLVAALPASPLGAQTLPVSQATLIQTIHTSLWSPPSPDPAGIAWRAQTQTLWTTDNEVDEMTIWGGANLWRHSRTGVVSGTFNLTGFTAEPGGISFDPAGGRVWISDDNQKVIYEVGFGPDGVFPSADDVRFDIDGLIQAGCPDPEDVTYNPFTGNLHVSSIDNSHALCTIEPGPNGHFDDVEPLGDDVVTIVPLEPLGAFPNALLKPKGITYDPIQNTLIVAERDNRDLFEFSIDGQLLRRIDGTVPGGYKPSGVTIAPSTVNPLLRALFVTDNAVDNGVDPFENDGKIHEFVVEPLNGNAAPVVDAGAPAHVRLPNANLALDGFVTDDGHPYPPSAFTSEWSLQSGPASVSFADPAAQDTTATFSKAGVYVLALEGDDFQLTTTDTVQVTVDPPAPPPGSCGVGPELAALLPALWSLRRRFRRSSAS